MPQTVIPQTVPVSVFDYSSLDAETSQFIQHETGEIRMLMRRSAQGIIEVGQKLIEVKKRLGHGNFEPWLKAEFDWGLWTARKFMQVAEQFKSVKFTDLSIAPSALYVLAAASTPETVREEALARAEAGEAITHSIAKEIKQKHSSASKLAKVESDKQPKSESKTQISNSLEQTQLRQRATSSRTSPPEILAIRPKEVVQVTTTLPKEVARETSPTSEKKSKLVESGSWLKLGEKHLLYCGNPNSSRFQERLPGQVALSLAFPTSHSDWQHSVSPQMKSALSLFTIYQDQDLALLEALVKNALELYTEGEEAVVFSFLPAPQLLLLADKLGCRCFVAEPDGTRCDQAIAAWKKTGGNAEKISGLRF